MIIPKTKLSRREGRNLYLKGSRSMGAKACYTRRQTRPGQHGVSMTRMSAYARQLRAKQSVKRYYMMREKQFRKFYDEAVTIAKNSNQDKGYVFLQLLERRLDNTIYKSGLAKSKSAARQLVSHGHVLVNGVKVKSPSYRVNINDEIEIKAKVFDKFKPDYKFPFNVKWITSNGNKCKVLEYPKREDIDQMFKESLIVELYSR